MTSLIYIILKYVYFLYFLDHDFTQLLDTFSTKEKDVIGVLDHMLTKSKLNNSVRNHEGTN